MAVTKGKGKVLPHAPVGQVRRRKNETDRDLKYRQELAVCDVEDFLTPEQRIENGMAVLDEALGENWPLMINLTTFQISSGMSCVLGQVFSPFTENGGNGFSEGEEALSNWNGVAQDLLYGADFGHLCGFDGGSVHNDLWKAALKERQDALGGAVVAREYRQRVKDKYISNRHA